MTLRQRLTRIFLWLSVTLGGIVLGAKYFDLRVLAGAWSHNPPESLRLLPYGANYPVDTGEFFQPISAVVLIAIVGALIAGWKTPWRYRLWLAIPVLTITVSLVFTVLWFWPRNAELWAIAKGAQNAVRDPIEAARMAQEWVRYDWLRVMAGLVGFVSSIRAISIPYPTSSRP